MMTAARQILIGKTKSDREKESYKERIQEYNDESKTWLAQAKDALKELKKYEKGLIETWGDEKEWLTKQDLAKNYYNDKVNIEIVEYVNAVYDDFNTKTHQYYLENLPNYLKLETCTDLLYIRRILEQFHDIYNKIGLETPSVGAPEARFYTVNNVLGQLQIKKNIVLENNVSDIQQQYMNKRREDRRKRSPEGIRQKYS